MNPSTAFRMLNKIRRDRAAAGCEFGVFALTKSGAPYKKPSTIHVTREQADVNAAYLGRLNPGSTYIVKSLKEVR